VREVAVDADVAVAPADVGVAPAALTLVLTERTVVELLVDDTGLVMLVVLVVELVLSTEDT